MAYIIKHLLGLLKNLYDEHKDPRVEHLPMVGSPFPMIAAIIAYLAFVLHYGPKWMEKREPYNLKHIMRLYNAVQVLANLTLFLLGVQNSYLRKEFSLTCQPLDHTNNEPWMGRLLLISYGYYITKYLDLLDTVFFVLRKKNNQITFLHVYHHAGMVFGVYCFMTFMPGSHSTMLGVINLFIHTVMYSYYFVTSLRPIKQALWWKRHITQLQLMQFGYLMLHFLMVIVRNKCQHPLPVALVGFMQNLFMFALFFDFYYKAYIRKPQQHDHNAKPQALDCATAAGQEQKSRALAASQREAPVANGMTTHEEHQQQKQEKLLPHLSKSCHSEHIYNNSSNSNSNNMNSNSSNSNSNNINKMNCTNASMRLKAKCS